MGSSPLMSLGVRAMAANYAALQSTGHNIANANVNGYSRQQTQLTTSTGQYTGAGFFGRGVDVTTVTRSHNEFLTREAASAKSLSAMDATRLTQLKQLETVFQTGESGLGYAVGELFDSMVDLSSQPGDLATRQVVLARANDLANRFAAAGSALDTTQAEVTASLRTAVSEINQIGQAIAATNAQISALRGAGHPANDVLDERDRLVGQLSERIRVTRIDADDGSVGLFIGSGQRLVLAGQAVEMAVLASDTDPTRMGIGLRENGQLIRVDDSGLGGGSLTGLLNFQNRDLANARNLVGQLAASVGSAVNDQQVRGISLQPPLGAAAPQPMFALGEMRGLPHAGNARDAGTGQPLGSVALSIADGRALQASDYDLRESASSPGRWQLTRLSDGQVSTVDSGDVVDGMRVDIVNAQPGDSFLLQPVSRAGNGMRLLLSSPLDIAAAAPLLATPAATNTGTAVASEVVVTAAPLPFAGSSETLQFRRLVPAVGGFDYEVSSSLGGGATPWATGLPLQGVNGFTLSISGVPGDGDSIVVAPTPATALASNNGNARALLALRDERITGGRTVSEAWSQSLADMGVRVQGAQSSSEISAAVAEQIEQQRSAQSGVNLDEEAARLIQYQQSYQAAAKVLQVAQSLFDTLLNTTAR